MSLAAFLGRLFGTMIDPVAWLPAGLVLFYTRSWPLSARLILAAIASMLAAIAVKYLLSSQRSAFGDVSPITDGALTYALAGLCWAIIFIAVAKLWRRIRE